MSSGIAGWVAAGIAVTLVGISACGYIMPQYRVYSSEADGRAKLAEAESSRRIAVLEAQAKLDAASKLSEAEIARARGVAQANEIIGRSLRDNEAYLRYLWIQSLEGNKGEVIYVPTEANLPILEANRLPARSPTPPSTESP